MTALLLLLVHLLQALGIDAVLYEDGALGIVSGALHISACVLPALGC